MTSGFHFKTVIGFLLSCFVKKKVQLGLSNYIMVTLFFTENWARFPAVILCRY